MIIKSPFDSDRTVGILLDCMSQSIQVKGKMPFLHIGSRGVFFITHAGLYILWLLTETAH